MGGLGHPSKCLTTIHSTARCRSRLGSQDLGTGTRTVIGMWAAETLGLPVARSRCGSETPSIHPRAPRAVRRRWAACRPRRGSRRLNALAKLFEVVAPALGVPADQLETADSRVQVKGQPVQESELASGLPQAGRQDHLGNGRERAARPGRADRLGVGGVQIADVSVDTETGMVKMNRVWRCRIADW